jgi:hypothetical protein
MRPEDEIRADLASVEVMMIRQAGANMAPNRLVADIPDLLEECERLRADAVEADRVCRVTGEKLALVKAERDKLHTRNKELRALLNQKMADARAEITDLRAALDAVRALCDEDWHRAMPGYLLISQVRAALAAAGVPDPTEEHR